MHTPFRQKSLRFLYIGAPQRKLGQPVPHYREANKMREGKRRYLYRRGQFLQPNHGVLGGKTKNHYLAREANHFLFSP